MKLSHQWTRGPDPHGLEALSVDIGPAEGIQGPEGVCDQKDSVTKKILRQRYPYKKSGLWYNQLKIGSIRSNLSPRETPIYDRILAYKYRSTPAPRSDRLHPCCPPPPRVTDPVADLPCRSTSSDTSTEELSPALLRAIQYVVAAALREHVPVAAPPRVAPPPEADALDEEDEEEIPVPVPPAGRRRNVPLPELQEVPLQWLARLEHLQKGLQDVKYQIEGTPEDEQQGVPFTETVMADELPLNCRTPAIAEYDGTADPMEHLSRFENAALLHRYTDGIKCRVFITTFAGVAQQWFNQLPVGAIGSFQEFRSLFLHQFASSRKVRKTELSLFAVCQKEDEPLKEYLQRFNTAALEFDALLARAAKYINMEEAQAAKKDSRGEKRKEVREDASSKKPHGDLKDRKPPFQRVNAVYTPLTIPITQAFMAVEEKGLITRPRSWRDTPQHPKSDKFCHFHNDYGHTRRNAGTSKMK
ncbi:UNVERIFIED_CONTAM: hypothetical protein Slati_3728300 [Sesamum latifolium]|uniref:Retrotransposon gag domain-containing protein n=1 Tax=Sesamum latifolium TaxID=2727402 RepID=A0AAW2U6Y8_9LAMI